MAVISHLAVNFTAGQTGSTSLSSGKATGDANPLGVFAGLLDALASAAIGGVAAAATGGNPLAAAIASLTRDATAAPTTDTATTPLSAISVPATDTTTPAPNAPKPLSDLVEALAALDKDQKAGTAPDAALLKKLNDAIDAVAGMLGLPLQTPLATPIATTDATSTGSLGAITAAPAEPPAPPLSLPSTPDIAADAPVPVTTQLAGLVQKVEQLATGLGKDQQGLADNLDAIAQKLNSGTLGAQTLQKLGLDANGAPGDALDAAINALISSSAAETKAALAPTPKFSKPVLQLPVATASGIKAATRPDKPTDSTPAAKPSNSKDAPDSGSSPTAKVAVTSHPNSDSVQKPETPAKTDAGPLNAASASSPAVDKADSAPTPAVGMLPAAAPTDQSSIAKTALAAYQPVPIAVNLPAMAYEIVRHVQDGSNNFQIRLDPADLGRVDVKLDMSGNGTVNAHLTVERPETLDLLRRDSQALGAALSQAGFDGGKTSLEFSLRQNPSGGQNPNFGGNGLPGGTASAETSTAPDAEAPPLLSTLYRGTMAASGVNIFV